MNNSPINSTINSTTVGELADATSLKVAVSKIHFPIGPGMIQQMQSPCDVCATQGEIISEAHKCGACKGKKTTKDKKVIEVFTIFIFTHSNVQKMSHLIFN